MPLPTPSRNEGHGLLPRAKGPETAHQNTVCDYKPDKYRQLYAHLVGVGREQLTDHHHQTGHHYELHDDADICRYGVAQQRYDHIAERQYGYDTYAHHHGRSELCRDRKYGTDAEHLHYHGIIF